MPELQSLSFVKEYAVMGKGIGFAINVSPVTLQDTHTPDQIYSLLKEFGVRAGQFTIEVTEAAAAENSTAVFESLMRLRRQGFQISIDGFGAGYSSLKLLSKMPFTELKIDRSLVAGASAEQSRPRS
jgi:EAL domain-containing protein (putative c-di-GMP-specific phosphodiesterase class I)